MTAIRVSYCTVSAMYLGIIIIEKNRKKAKNNFPHLLRCYFQ